MRLSASVTIMRYEASALLSTTHADPTALYELRIPFSVSSRQTRARLTLTFALRKYFRYWRVVR